MIVRTREGVEALVDSVTAALEEPERLVYLVAGETTVWSKLFGWKTLEKLGIQPQLPSLAVTSLRCDASPVLLSGLAGGWLGDNAKLSAPEKTPVLGMLGIAANHAAYSAKLYDRGARPSLGRAGLRAAAWVTGIGLASRKKKQLTAPTIVAGLFVAATSTLADDRSLQDGTNARKGLGHGGNLLFAAEGIALLRETVFTGNSFAHRALDAAMRSSHVIGHMLMVDGLTRDCEQD